MSRRQKRSRESSTPKHRYDWVAQLHRCDEEGRPTGEVLGSHEFQATTSSSAQRAASMSLVWAAWLGQINLIEGVSLPPVKWSVGQGWGSLGGLAAGVVAADPWPDHAETSRLSRQQLVTTIPARCGRCRIVAMSRCTGELHRRRLPAG